MEETFEEHDSSDTWRQYFFTLRKKSTMASIDRDTKHAMSNRRLNRYADVLPFDENRVILEGGGDSNSYINASEVSFEETKQKYIICQGPMEYTCSHFWQMIQQKQVSTIVMLCKTVENQKAKCAQYWPANFTTPVTFESGQEQVTVELVSCERFTAYNISKLEFTSSASKSTRTITHLHYHAWPDFGIPDSPDSFLRFLCLARHHNTAAATDTLLPLSPPVVHCSAGIGRSGVYAVCDIMIQLLLDSMKCGTETLNADTCFDHVLLQLRQQRMGLIQAPDQLRFAYLAILRAKEVIYANQWPNYFLDQNVESSMQNGHARNSQLESDSDEEFDMPAPPPPLRVNSLQSNGPSSTPVSQQEPLASAASSAELRQRKQKETADKVAEIKRKMKQTESRQNFWNEYWPHIFGIGAVLIGTCFYLYYKHSWTASK